MPHGRCDKCHEIGRLTIVSQREGGRNTFGRECIRCTGACTFCYCDLQLVVSGQLEGCDHCQLPGQ